MNSRQRLTIELHPGASHPDQWRIKGRSAVHLRRGELEGSISGWYAACSALILLGVASRSHVRTLLYEHQGKLEEFANEGMRSHRGLSPKGMTALLETVGAFVETQRINGGVDRKLRAVLNRMSQGDACIVCISDTDFHYSDWRLAVGVERRTDTTGEHATALLVLDSHHSCRQPMVWNARLDLGNAPEAPMLYYSADGSICHARLKAVFALSKKQAVPWI